MDGNRARAEPGRSRRLPTRSYSLSLQPLWAVDPHPPDRWTSNQASTRTKTLPKSMPKSLANLPKSSATLPKEALSSPPKKRNTKQKRGKSRKTEKLVIEHPHVFSPENEIDRFEREFVKPMLDSRKMMDKVKSSDDLSGANKESCQNIYGYIQVQANPF